MELYGSHLGSLGFSRNDIYESVLMCFKDAICLRKILLKLALDTVLLPPPHPRKSGLKLVCNVSKSKNAQDYA